MKHATVQHFSMIELLVDLSKPNRKLTFTLRRGTLAACYLFIIDIICSLDQDAVYKPINHNFLMESEIQRYGHH